MAKSEQATVASLWREYVEYNAFAHRQNFDFAGVRIQFWSNSDPLVAELSAYFREFMAAGSSSVAPIDVYACEGPVAEFRGEFIEQPREDGKTGLKERFCELTDGRIVQKHRTGMHFVFGSGYHLAIGPCLANVPQVVNFINSRVLEVLLRKGCLLGHASAVINNGHAVAFCGFSGAGKSTAALEVLAHSPVSLLSNDRIAFYRDGEQAHVFGIAKHPRINPGTILANPALQGLLPASRRAQLAQMPADELWNLEEKHDCIVHEVFGPCRFELQAKFRALFFLNWRRGAGRASIHRLNLAQRVEMLGALIKRPGLFFQALPGHAEPPSDTDSFLDALSVTELFEVRGGVDLPTVVRACDELLGCVPTDNPS